MTESKKGVGGWLLLFLILIFVSPLGIISQTLDTLNPIVDTLLKLTEAQGKNSFGYPHFYLFSSLLILIIILSLGLSIFAIFTGIRLAKIHQSAIITVRKFLVSYMIFGILLALFNFIHARASLDQGIFEILTASLQAFVAFAGFYAVWTSYFLKSKRVLATYSNVPTETFLEKVVPMPIFVTLLLLVIGLFLYFSVYNFHQIFDTEVRRLLNP